MELSEKKSCNLPEVKAMEILENYDGSNNFILKLKKTNLTKKNFKLTRSQSEYIIQNHSVIPKIARKWVNIDLYFSEKIFKDKLLLQPPSKVYIEKLLSETDKSYHVWGKFFESDELSDFYLPKASILKREKEVSVDYGKDNTRPPMEHQKIAIEKLIANDKYLLADDMGLGKTTSTVIASIESGAEKVLIICPATLKINWMREIENYTDKKVSIIEGKKWAPADYTIINYDILKNVYKKIV